jgi:hypothetical protein
MPKAGAPADAVSFKRAVYRQSDAQVGIMTAFHKVGPVGEARVMCPLPPTTITAFCCSTANP